MEGRCGWVNTPDPVYAEYHDTEWGVPERDPRALWEKLTLDGFQAGLAWITILRKRETLRTAFAGFDPREVAQFGAADIDRLLGDPGVIRSRAKIEAAIGGARIWCDMTDKGEDFSGYIWSFVGGRPVQNSWASFRDAPTATPASEALAKDLKRRGFKFCGPVICYAFLQAVGCVNDHEAGCPRHAACASMA